MKYCWYESKPKLVRILEPWFYLFLFFILLHGIRADRDKIPVVPLLFMAVCCLLFICYALLNWFVNERKYRVSERGITVQYPFGIRRVYVWSDFRDITLCKVRFIPKDPRSYSIAIRCAVETEYPGPRSAFSADESWSKEFYDTLHWEKLVTIESTPERYQEFASFCPQTIHDYTDLPN